MAFFKSRKGGDDAAASVRQPESIEAMRRRAKHRLIGASVLVLIGVVGFPLLFDTQPRPISVDIPIEIPDRNKAKPLPLPAPQPAPAATQAAPPAPPSASSTVANAAPPPAASAAKAEASTPKAEPPKSETRVAAKTEAPPAESKPAPRADDGAKALALLEGKPVASTPVEAEGRFVVQVGAFADAAKAREARLKVEHAGLKTYTQVVETKDGKRIRVRLGPFANKSDAERAAEKVKGLDLPASVLTL
ncbi:MAG TPA: SPOR domain-containing protein [Ramlibacter sp.]